MFILPDVNAGFCALTVVSSSVVNSLVISGPAVVYFVVSSTTSCVVTCVVSAAAAVVASVVSFVVSFIV